MAIKHTTQIQAPGADLLQSQLVNAAIQVLIADPGSPVDGQVWYRSDTGELVLWMGGNRRSFAIKSLIANADIAAGAAIALSKLATDPLARANHTGTQTASTISDLATYLAGVALSSLAAPTAALSMGSQRVTNVADPTGAQDAATKSYVDTLKQGLDWKDSVRAATTANITLSGTQTVDGVSLVAGDRVLVKDQTTGSQNGIYVVAAGAWTRAVDFDAASEVVGAYIPIEEGAASGDKFAVQTVNAPVTLNTTALAFSVINSGTTYVQGTGITISGATISLATPVSIANGGTGQTTAAAARVALGAAAIAAGDIVGNGSSTALAFTHGLGTKDIQVNVWEASTDALVVAEVVRTSTTVVTVNFATAPANGKTYRVVVTAAA